MNAGWLANGCWLALVASGIIIDCRNGFVVTGWLPLCCAFCDCRAPLSNDATPFCGMLPSDVDCPLKLVCVWGMKPPKAPPEKFVCTLGCCGA